MCLRKCVAFLDAGDTQTDVSCLGLNKKPSGVSLLRVDVRKCVACLKV